MKEYEIEITRSKKKEYEIEITRSQRNLDMDLPGELIFGIPGPCGPQGPQGPAGPEGRPGKDGTVNFSELTEEQKAEIKGDPGRGIVSIERTDGSGVAGTFDTYTITFTDDTTSTFKVYNGANGTGNGNGGGSGATFFPHVDADGNLSWTNDMDLPNPDPVNIKGEKGDKGDPGEKGEQGEQGIQGEKGDKGDTGAPGANGKDGQNGYTPVRGTDYWTEDDKAEIISALCAVLYTEQELTEEQQAQARANIGASAVKVNLDNGVLSIE